MDKMFSSEVIPYPDIKASFIFPIYVASRISRMLLWTFCLVNSPVKLLSWGEGRSNLITFRTLTSFLLLKNNDSQPTLWFYNIYLLILLICLFMCIRCHVLDKTTVDTIFNSFVMPQCSLDSNLNLKEIHSS